MPQTNNLIWALYKKLLNKEKNKSTRRNKPNKPYLFAWSLDFLNLPVDVVKKIFNSLCLPIFIYGSEVWSIYDKDDYNSWEKDIIIWKNTIIYISANKSNRSVKYPKY